MFPNYKKKLWWKVPDGWEDRGEVVEPPECKVSASIKAGFRCYTCGNLSSIGYQKGKAFRFCKRCLVKL